MSGDAWIKEAYEAIWMGDFERAAACFELAIAEQPNCASYYYKLSVTCARSGYLERALTAVRRASELSPEEDSYRQHLNHVLALCYREQAKKRLEDLEAGKRDENRFEALQLLREAVRLDPLSAQAYMVMAAVLEESGNKPEALQAVQEALHLDPNLKEAVVLSARLTAGRPLFH
ncbi:tetratricopeptide repeat protein [Gorillibacterium timonense]|uniref:tetratricopeptide repeat protein n=1 Tax=Gorillibacterium timonense TaxID=1689269 RepID=UPI00071E49B3|nr:tetratricopeptide repeat protein [Gorillibacterium timonense]